MSLESGPHARLVLGRIDSELLIEAAEARNNPPIAAQSANAVNVWRAT